MSCRFRQAAKKSLKQAETSMMNVFQAPSCGIFMYLPSLNEERVYLEPQNPQKSEGSWGWWRVVNEKYTFPIEKGTKKVPQKGRIEVSPELKSNCIGNSFAQWMVDR